MSTTFGALLYFSIAFDSILLTLTTYISHFEPVNMTLRCKLLASMGSEREQDKVNDLHSLALDYRM
jgi:hypothetical protein